jgi:hypothetical protein
MATINDIKNVIGRRGGLARPNRFKVDFTGLLAAEPGSVPIPGLDPESTRDLNFLVDNIGIPGRAINTFEYAIWNHPIKIPIGYDEDDIEIVFNLTNDFMPKKIIDAWSAIIINQNSYLAEYDSAYKKDVIIWQLDENDNIKYGVKLLGAYPIASKGLFLDNSAESTVSRFSCTLTFDKFINEPIPNEGVRAPRSLTTTDGIRFGAIG